MQQHEALRNWQRERDAVEAEMNALLASGFPASPAERQVRQVRFRALIERREAAARDLLQFDRSVRHHKSTAAQAEIPKGPSQDAASEVIAATPVQELEEPGPPLAMQPAMANYRPKEQSADEASEATAATPVQELEEHGPPLAMQPAMADCRPKEPSEDEASEATAATPVQELEEPVAPLATQSEMADYQRKEQSESEASEHRSG